MEWVLAGVATNFFAQNIMLSLKDRRFRQSMEALEKSRNFDLDYLPDIDALPRDKNICVRAAIEIPEEGMRPAFVDNEEKVALSRVAGFIQEPDDIRELEGDSYVVSLQKPHLKQAEPLYISNDKGEAILLDLNCKDDVIFHNTYIVKDIYELNKTKNMAERLMLIKDDKEIKGRFMIEANLTNPKAEIFEMGLRNGECYNFFGKAIKYDGSIANPKQVPLMFKSSIVTGEMKENVMRYMDNRIEKMAKKQKMNIGLMIGFCTASIAYRRFVKPAVAEYRLQKTK